MGPAADRSSGSDDSEWNAAGGESCLHHYQLYDPVSRRLIVFGGDLDTSGEALTDSWILTDAVGSLAGAFLNLDVHGSGSSSNLNGVLEPGESVVVEPAWSNLSAASWA